MSRPHTRKPPRTGKAIIAAVRARYPDVRVIDAPPLDSLAFFRKMASPFYETLRIRDRRAEIRGLMPDERAAHQDLIATSPSEFPKVYQVVASRCILRSDGSEVDFDEPGVTQRIGEGISPGKAWEDAYDTVQRAELPLKYVWVGDGPPTKPYPGSNGGG